jgi:SAM-dependent methyltransferase
MNSEFFGFCKGLIDNNFLNIEINDMYGERFSKFYTSYISSLEDLSYYKDICMKHGRSVLELGCGSGRITIPLAKAGISIEGVDTSPHMIGILKSKANGLGLDINVYMEDFNTFMSSKKYDTIIMPTCTIQLVADRNIFLKNVRSNLRDGGVFVFTYFEYELSELSSTSDRLVLFDKLNMSYCIIEERIIKEECRVLVNLYLEDVLENGVVKRHLASAVTNMLIDNIFENELTLAGFITLERNVQNYKQHRFVSQIVQVI